LQIAVCVPSHEPPHTLPSVEHGARPPTGCVLAGAGEQVPAEPARLHAWHWPVHAPLQHTPSTQKPDWHWLLPLHSAGIGFLPWHCPLALQ
jgi:hypothetical protein